MKAEKVLIQYPNTRKKDKVIEDSVIYTDGSTLHIKSREPGESMQIKNFFLNSISREYISFVGYLERNDRAFDIVHIHIKQTPSA